MLLNYVLRQGYQVLKRYVLLFLALIPYILPIIPQININISSIPQKAMIVFVVLHIILIYGRTLFTYSLLQTTLHLLRFLFHHPKRKENSLCIFPVPGTGNAQRLYRRRNNRNHLLRGGTPSQLSQEDFISIFSHIYKVYNVEPDAEITLEANPDDLTPEYITMLRSLPFNRLSMGIQTFNEDMLKLLQRRHTADRAIHAFNNCRRAGFHNISIDLMYGLPGETLDSWQKDLEQAVNLHPEHISAYHLIYEENTALWKLREQHKVAEADEDLSVSLFGTLIDSLSAAGYDHYEISNFCLPGLHSRHNSSYWTGKKYLGCGPSAHSYNGISRQWNIASLNEYIKGIDGGIPAFEIEELDLSTRYNDFVITGIRTKWGMPLSKLRKEYGEELYAYCLRMAQPYLKQGTLEIVNDTLKLTRPGIFISDGIMSDMLRVED